jgi:hypothetical protein
MTNCFEVSYTRKRNETETAAGRRQTLEPHHNMIYNTCWLVETELFPWMLQPQGK